MEYESLTPGYKFPSCSMTMGASAVRMYREAVGDSTLPDQVPPSAIAAMALSTVLKHLDLVPGTLHASQELSFFQSIKIGTTLVHSASVVQNSTRGGWRWLVVDLATLDNYGMLILSGRSTVLFPES